MGARHTHGWRDYTQLFAERVRCDLRRHRDLILNAAVDGSTSLDCLADLDRVLGAYRPDVAMLMIGTNDSAMDRRISPERCKNALRAIVAKLREVGAHVVLQTPNHLLAGFAVSAQVWGYGAHDPRNCGSGKAAPHRSLHELGEAISGLKRAVSHPLHVRRHSSQRFRPRFVGASSFRFSRNLRCRRIETARPLPFPSQT